MSAGDRAVKLSTSLTARLKTAVPAACVGVYLLHLWCVWRYAVNIPYWDEWDMFTPGQLQSGLSLRWLFAQQNEHRMVTTKLLIWVFYKLDGWNVATHQTVNFVIYGAVVALIAYAARRLAPETPAWAHLGFVFFLLTTISIENHLMALQMAYHFWLLFFLASVYFLFSPEQRTPALLAGCAASTLSAYSLAAGVVSGLVTIITFAAFKMLRARSDAHSRRRELTQLLLVVIVAGGPIALWSVGHQRPLEYEHVNIYDAAFWHYFLNIVSLNLGVTTVSDALGAVCLLIVVAPLCVLVFEGVRRMTPAQWAVVATTMSIIGVLALIAIGRAAFGTTQSKSSRYSEIGMALVPVSALAWGFALRRRPELKRACLAALWLFFFATFLNNWRFWDYAYYHRVRDDGARCVREYYLKGGEAVCPTVYPAPLGPMLDAARDLNVSFYRELSPPERGGEK